MPVEIRELIIRAVVDTSRDGQKSKPDAEPGLSSADTDAIIEECVKQVMKLLKKTGER